MSSEPHAPRILCYDCDAFFVQCARLAWPQRLAEVEPLIVGGHPQRRGVVCSCSYEARRFGVHSGMPMATALRQCPQALAVPVPWATVRRRSRRVREVIRRFAAALEPASVDEGYLAVPAGDEPLEVVARRVQAAVREEAGITVSLGGATRRFLAKMATSAAKPAGVFVVPAGAELEFLDRHGLGDIPGVGPAFVRALERRGVVSVAGARALDLKMLTTWLGPARAAFLYQRVRALDPTPVGEGRGPRRSISSETTFASDVAELATLENALRGLVADVGASLRRLGLRARTVGVKLREHDFADHQKTRTLPEAVETDPVVLAVALELLHELRREYRRPVRLIGVGLAGLAGPGYAEQLAIPEIIPPLETDEDRRRAREGGNDDGGEA